MSDNQVVTCSDCGTRMRIPDGKTKGRCPKCKLWMEFVPAAVVPSEPSPIVVVEVPTASSANVATVPPVISPSVTSILARTVVAGILLGILLTFAVSWARSGLGPMIPIAVVGVLTVIPILHVIVLLLRTPAPVAPGSQPSVSFSQRLLTFELAVLALPFLSVSVGYVLPDGMASLIPEQRQRVAQGRAELDRVSREIEETKKNFLKPQTHEVKKPPFDVRPNKQEETEKLATLDPTPWRNSDFLLVNPTHYAVGIKDIGEPKNPKFQILSKAENRDALEAQKIAWESKTPIIGIDEPLTRTVYQLHSTSETLKPIFQSQMLKLFEPRQLLPQQSTLIAYFDTVNNVPRVGHMMNDADDRFEFADLVPRRKPDAKQPFEFERILRAERVKPESEQRDLNELSLRSSTDLLDYFVYQILNTIQHSTKPLYQSGEPFIFVDTARADITEYGNRLAEISLRRSDALGELNGVYGAGKRPNAGGLIALFNRMVTDHEDELGRRSVMSARRKELTEEVRELKLQIVQLRGLIDAEKRLTSDIRTRLLRAGIKQVERSEHAQQLIQGERKRWDKPSSEEAVDTKLSIATHLLLTEIRRPDQSGRYQLSMRLVDVLKGEIMWEDQGDRQDTRPSSSSNLLADGFTLKGAWRTSEGDHVEITEDKDGAMQVAVTTANGQITYEISARRKARTITVESCTASFQRGAKTYRSTVRAEVRILEDDVLEIACPNVGVNKSRLVAGDMVRSRFQKWNSRVVPLRNPCSSLALRVLAMDEFLDFLLNGDFGMVLLLCGLVYFIGWLFTGNDAELILYRHRAWYGTFLVFGAYAFLQYGTSDGNVIIVLLLRTLMTASLGAGIVGVCSPLLRWYRQGVEQREADKKQRQYERERKKREAQEAKEREAEQRRSQQLMVVRDKEQRVQEVERSKQQHQDQLDAQRRMRACAACDLFFNLHKAELAPRFSKGDLDDFMKKYMTDGEPPEIVEMYALELKKTMEQHLELSEAKRKPKNIEQLAKWYIEEKDRIGNLNIDEDLKDYHQCQLNERYNELSQEILESVTP